MISVIMPILNADSGMDRSIISLRGQSSPMWELIAVDDTPSVVTYGRLLDWHQKDQRIKVVRNFGRRGPSAARNLAISRATYNLICYIECGDEYDVSYLANVLACHHLGAVLIFCFELLNDDDQGVASRLLCNPARSRDHLFSQSIAPTLAIAHSRGVFEKAGGFNEGLWYEEQWDLLKRFARSGEEFVYLPSKSGTRDGTNRVAHHAQVPADRYNADLRRHARNECLYERQACRKANDRLPKVVYASPHCIFDRSNGAAVAMHDTLLLLADRGIQAQAFCGTKFETDDEFPIDRTLNDSGMSFHVENTWSGPHSAQVIYAKKGRVPTTMLRMRSSRHDIVDPSEVDCFLSYFDQFLHVNRHDVLLTFAAGDISRAMMKLAKRRDMIVVVAIHNLGYTDTCILEDADLCFVPSHFACSYYWDHFSINCNVLPNPVNWGSVRATHSEPRYVTFINPCAEKGVYPFVRVAEGLGQRRPDIPLLVVESRGTRAMLAACGLGRDAEVNVRLMPFTPDPRQFWSVTRIALMPSLCWESQGLVAVEAMINGIPVIGSDRGALPETLGDAGFVLPLPDRLTPDARIVPTAEEVEPWVEAIIRLWDDTSLYERHRAAAIRESQRWHPDRLGPLFEQYFGTLSHQPGPPFR